MTGFFWNIRGFNKQSKQTVVQNWIRNKEFQFGCLLETRVKEGKAAEIVESVCRGWSFVNNYEFSRKGRIWVLWSPQVRVTPVFKSSQIITVSVLLEGEQEEFFCSFVYAENIAEQRKELWEDIKSHQDSAMFRNKEWIIMGDFNEILEVAEHSNYQEAGVMTAGMKEFESVVQHCHFTDMSYQGPKFTWCNRRDEGIVCKKLDRILVNEAWLHKRTQAYCVFEAGGCSDHLRGRFHLKSEAIGKRRPFKFTNAVAEMPEFLQAVGDFWKDKQPLFQSTSALFRFSKTLKALKPLIRSLSKKKLGDLTKKVKEAYQELCERQEETLKQPTHVNIQRELQAAERWQRVSAIEEKLLKQRSKLHWLQVGDKNNRVFHNAVKIRETRNAIKEIRCPSGQLVNSQEDIKQEAERFFSEFLACVPEGLQGKSVEEMQRIIGFRCSEVEKSSLIKQVTDEEIRDVLFKMPSGKSPGPDGFTAEFFKASWSIISKDFTTAVHSFFSKGFLPKGLNTTILALIPKKDEAMEMRDYRPISCCNVLYKVLSKIIANRLKGTLPQCISYNQSAFVKDRLLVENLLLATEIVKDYHREDISPRCAMKIDIAKAFDSVHWPFLLNTLRAFDMPEQFIHWIELCVCTPSFSVQVNGELAGFFQSKRGLRQGCALSPYLFVVCMNVLSQMLDKAAERKEISYHPRCQNIQLTHLCFADDLLVFTDGTKRSIEGILRIFEEFAGMSGLKISLEKSTLYIAGITEVQESDILTSFPFASGKLPVRYLGLPLLTRRMTVSDYLPLVEKIKKKMRSWTGRFLSHAGRLQLITSVIMSLTNFWLAAFRLPSSCLKEIERLCAAFLWSGPDLKTTKAKVSWKDLCFPKNEGGLGIRSLKEVNKVHCLKLIWRLSSSKASLWVKWVHCYLIRKGSFWSTSLNTSLGSWMWKKLLKMREFARNFIRKEVGNGKHTSFWYETWCQLGCLKEVMGDRGFIAIGIENTATVADVLRTHRRRRHRVRILNEIEDEIDKLRSGSAQDMDDVPLWRSADDKYGATFSSKKTWMRLRVRREVCTWSRGVWFSQATPKYSFMTWIAMRNRMHTGDKMQAWNALINTECVLCHEVQETCQHLFFSCPYSLAVWECLVRGILKEKFTAVWDDIVEIISGSAYPATEMFLLRYSFQAALHNIWWERNARRHGEEPKDARLLSKLVDKTIRL